MSRAPEATEELLEELIDAGVLVPRDDDEFVLDDEFDAERERLRRELADSDRFEREVTAYTADRTLSRRGSSRRSVS
jgi:hypothetical protein